MNKQRQTSDEYIIQELAKIEGFTSVEYGGNGHPWGFLEGSHGEFCNYLNSHDAMQRVIDGMDDEELIRYVTELTFITSGVDARWSMSLDIGDLKEYALATPEQKVEAVLKAYERWTTTEEGL